MGKMVVLKPVVWNDRGYLEPAGLALSGGYAGEHGYGHEEWNARPDWTWQGWKVFHTEGKGRMLKHAENGDLGIIMTAMEAGRFYAVGVACNVYSNEEAERVSIAKDLNLFANGEKLWKLPAVRKRKEDDKAAFLRHWKESYQWVRWRCLPTHFHWFSKRIEIIPNDIIPAPSGSPPRQAIVKMHGSYQAIRPDQALAVIGDALPPDHPIVSWLQSGDFDSKAVSAKVRTAPNPTRNPPGGRSAAPASAAYRRYILENEVLVTPRHHDLQTAFKGFIEVQGATGIKADVERVDLRFTDRKHGLVFAEIKPAEPSTVRYAIRAAIGQLLDYRQKTGTEPRLLIVVGAEPSDQDDRDLALTNGFGLAWRSGGGFSVLWP